MYNIIPLILILISLIIIIFITVRKFPMLANLDFENIPAEKEAKFKERIISERLKRNFSKWGLGVTKIVKPVVAVSGNFFNSAYDRLVKFKESYKKDLIGSDFNSHDKLDVLFSEVDELIKKEELDEAEKKLIEIIGVDNRNIKAFKMLGGLYFDRKNYEEAKQTFEYILKFKENDDETYGLLGNIAREKGSLNEAREDYLKSIDINSYRSQTFFDLGLVYKTMGNLEEAVVNIEKALDIEPNNPRYLDTMVEISIIRKDKDGALLAFEKLAEVNPENQKLGDLQQEIGEL